MTNTRIKMVVTGVAIILLVLHSWVKFEFDSLDWGLLFVAVLPWLSSFLSSAELPGGWKLEFRQVKEEQKKQRDEIERLKFLIEEFVSEDELRHLRKISGDTPFLITVDGTTKYFEGELRRLRAFGLIENPPGKGIGTLLINDGRARDVKEHFQITNKGMEYLRFRDAPATD
jgi:hypothetical protein